MGHLLVIGHLEDREGDGRITLRWMLGKCVMKVGRADGTGPGSCSVAGFGINGVEPPGSPTV
jgi:hypothetical protein